MKIFLDNVNINSSSGPNSFAKKLVPQLIKSGCEVVSHSDAEISLCFIESRNHNLKIPRVQRLDGIYFNTDQNYISQNENIKRTFDSSKGIIYQSTFNKELITKYFGNHENNIVIHNGADQETIKNIEPMKNEKYDKIWSCAASWRPHKRLSANIDYFLEHKGFNDLLVVAGQVPLEQQVKEESVVYFGNLSQEQLYSLYKSSTNFLHLAWLDHCPNVVVDARASGCHIICSSEGGTKEIAGLNSTIIEENPWDFKPTRLYDPPRMDFSRKIKNNFDSCYHIEKVSQKYKRFLENTLCL
jgi:glycosyltransferase involved in cell wall biosynthesis